LINLCKEYDYAKKQKERWIFIQPFFLLQLLKPFLPVYSYQYRVMVSGAI